MKPNNSRRIPRPFATARQAAVLLLASSLAAGTGAVAKSKSPVWESNLNAGRQALSRGDYVEAGRYLRTCLDETRKFKDGDARMGVTLRSMGDLYVREQNYSLAKEYYERALAVDQPLLGAEHLDVAEELYGLALCSQQLGDHLAAEVFLKRVEEIWKKKLGTTHPKLLSILPAEAAYASMKNNFALAETYYRDVVAIQEKELGANNSRLGNYLNLLALVLGNEGKLDEAKRTANRAVELLKQSGDQSIALDSARDNLTIIERKAKGEVKTTDGPGPASDRAGTDPVSEDKKPSPKRPETAMSKPESPLPEQPSTVKPDEQASTASTTPPSSESETASKNRRPSPKVTASAKESTDQKKDADLVSMAGPQAGSAKPEPKPPKGKEPAARAADDAKRPWETDRPIRKPDNDKSQSWGKVRYLADGRLISAEEYKALLLASEAYEMLKQEKYRMACDILKKAVDVYPAVPSVQTNLGLALSRLGQTDEAIEHLQQSIALDASRPAPWVNLASCFQTSGRLGECVDTYDEYLKRFPQDSLAYKAKDLVKHLKQELEEQREVERAVASSGQSGANDYFPYTTYESTVKWPRDKQPVKVHIASGSRVPGYKSEYEGIFQDAFKQWEDASGGGVSFAFVPKPEAANIHCVWTNDLTEVSSPAEGGEAQLTWGADGIDHVKVLILTNDPTPDSPLTANQVRAVCLHEIGHSLGLVGHSPRPQDVMYCTMPAADTKVSLSSRDVSTIKKLYSPDVLIAVKHRPSHLDPADKKRINNEGVEFMESKAYSKAIEKFEEALKVDPDYETAKENLAKACNNYAVELTKSGKTGEAESLFQKAMNIQVKIRNVATRLTTLENYANFLRRLRRDKEATRLEQEARKLKDDGSS